MTPNDGTHKGGKMSTAMIPMGSLDKAALLAQYINVRGGVARIEGASTVVAEATKAVISRGIKYANHPRRGGR